MEIKLEKMLLWSKTPKQTSERAFLPSRAREQPPSPYSELQTSVRPPGPAEGGSPETREIPVQKTDSVTCRLGDLCAGRAGCLNCSKEHTPTKFSPGALASFLILLLRRFLLRCLDAESGFSAQPFTQGPDFQQESCFVQKGILYKGVPVFLPR